MRFKFLFSLFVVFFSVGCQNSVDSKSNSDPETPAIGAQVEAAGATGEVESQEDSQASTGEKEESAAAASENADPVAQTEIIKMLTDFETPGRRNTLGGEWGAWDSHPDDSNSGTVAEVIALEGIEGPSNALKLAYKAHCDEVCESGLWMRMMYFDASEYDHLALDVKGDPSGHTDILKIELKKYKFGSDSEQISGTSRIPVTDDWQTIKIPLNTMTGLFDFSNEETWSNPSVSRTELYEFVINFHNRLVSSPEGTVYIDNIRFLKTGDPGPTPLDSPPRKGEKTPVRLEGADFANFLVKRLQGFTDTVAIRKEFPEDDEAFLRLVAKDTWRFFDEIVDAEHGLPLDTIQLGEEVPIDDTTIIGDYTNVTNIGIYLMCLVSAVDLDFISHEEARERLQLTLDTLEIMEAHESGFLYNYYDTTTLERTSYFVSLVDSGWLTSGLYVVRSAFPEMTEQIDRLLAARNFAFFYDDVDRQMWHGYYDNLGVYVDYHYGPLYSEPRAISYMAIGRGEVPMEHWFKGMKRMYPEEYKWQEQTPINRTMRTTLGYTYYSGHYQWEDLTYVPSWGGSAFEALLPTMVLDEQGLAPKGLGLNGLRHAQGQMRYAMEELGYPVWGMSPSSVPEGGYSEFGAAPFGFKGYHAKVVTPHASALALDFIPQEATDNLRRLAELYDIYGPYGFYDAVTVETGLVAKKYLALDQGMILLAINNYLNDGSIRKHFHAHPDMAAVEVMLSEEDFQLDAVNAN